MERNEYLKSPVPRAFLTQALRGLGLGSLRFKSPSLGNCEINTFGGGQKALGNTAPDTHAEEWKQLG